MTRKPAQKAVKVRASNDAKETPETKANSTARKKSTDPRKVLSAAEERAKRMGWSEVDLRVRKEIADAAREVLNCHRKQNPGMARFFAVSALMQMKKAVADCRQLDLARKGQGMEPLYVDLATSFNTDRALAGMHCRTMAEWKVMNKGKTPRLAAVLQGDYDRAERKRTLEMIRETIRDGWDVSFALEVNSEGISERLEAGDAKFFEELGELLRGHRCKPLRRGLMEWIVRAWLPLCLWECDKDGRDAYDRFSVAAKLLGLEVHSGDSATFFHRFITAWRNVRSKVMKVRWNS